MPWIRVNGSLNRRVLDKWMGLILLYCLQNPGVTVGSLSLRFNLMHPVQVRLLLEVIFVFLNRLGRFVILTFYSFFSIFKESIAFPCKQW